MPVENVLETTPPPIDLGTLGGTYSTPTGINDNGVVVGSSTTGAKEQHAFVWMPTNGMVDLGTFGDRSAPGWPLRTSFATAVSNAGEVVGASYVPRLSSVPGRLSSLPVDSVRRHAESQHADRLFQLCHRNQRCGTGCRQQRWFLCEPGFRRVDSDGRMGGHRHARWGRAAGGHQQPRPGRRHQQPRNRVLPRACVPVDRERRHGGPGHAGRAVECGRGREPERPGRRMGADRRRSYRT